MKIKKSKKNQPFTISNLEFLQNKKKLLLKPSYQRNPVWALSQKQLFIDSLFQNIDIPKLYFRDVDKSGYEYEVVDGQQRLRAIFGFLENEFRLSLDSDKVEEEEIAGREFSELSTDLQMYFKNVSLDIVVLNSAYTDEDIEEMFLRLQNGTPLNAAEKRRAISSGLRDVVGELSKHKVFKLCSFSDGRYAYEDAIAKILHIELNGNITDIKPSSIRKTYENNKTITKSHPKIARCQSTLNAMSDSFVGKPNPGFKKFAILTLSHVMSYLLETYNLNKFKKEFAQAYLCFEERRIKNEELPEDKQDSRLAAYTDAARADSVQDMAYRSDIIVQEIIRVIPELELKDPQRGFSNEQRLAIYLRDEGICQECKKRCDQDNFHADHIKLHSNGGKTKISNGQVLCPDCNLKKNDKGKK